MEIPMEGGLEGTGMGATGRWHIDGDGDVCLAFVGRQSLYLSQAEVKAMRKAIKRFEKEGLK